MCFQIIKARICRVFVFSARADSQARKLSFALSHLDFEFENGGIHSVLAGRNGCLAESFGDKLPAALFGHGNVTLFERFAKKFMF